jgi:hypothetical protein
MISLTVVSLNGQNWEKYHQLVIPDDNPFMVLKNWHVVGPRRPPIEVPNQNVKMYTTTLTAHQMCYLDNCHIRTFTYWRWIQPINVLVVNLHQWALRSKKLKKKSEKKFLHFFFSFSVIKTHSLTLATKEYMYRMHIEDVHVLMWQLSR